MVSENDDDMVLAMSSISMFNKPSNTSEPFFSSGWDPIVSQGETLGGSSMASRYHHVMENQGICGTSHVSLFQSDSSFVELVPKLTGFDGENLPQIVGPLGLSQCNQTASNRRPQNYVLNAEGGNERCSTNGLLSLDEYQISEKAFMDSSPIGKIRKRAHESDSQIRSSKIGDDEPQMDLSSEVCDDPKERDLKKQKTEQNTSGSSRSKQAAKQDKDGSQSGEEAPKENYIHVRARRGQATNSHSLAERVRREKISERMRLLQELVPGCNKITGKAVMLDEIINYVQSLQQQVEFLSMKLATVNPELNLELDRILSKDILHTSGSAAALGFGRGMNSSHTFTSGIIPGTTSGIPNTNPQFPQAVLDIELHNLFQMGFYSGSTIDGFGPNGPFKPEM